MQQQQTSGDDFRKANELPHLSPRREFNQRRTQTIFLAEVWPNPLPWYKHLVKSTHITGQSVIKTISPVVQLGLCSESDSMNCRCYGNFRAASPTISRVECATEVMSFPRLVFRPRNTAHETFRVTTTGDNRILARAATANWTLAPRSWSVIRMPTGTVEDISRNREGGSNLGNWGGQNWPASKQQSSLEMGVSLHWC